LEYTDLAESIVLPSWISERVQILDLCEVSPVLAILERSARIIPFQISNDECVERLLTRFVFEPLEHVRNEEVAVEVGEIVCQTRSQAEALAKRLERFADKNRKTDPDECWVRASVVQYSDGWCVESVSGRGEEVAA